MAVPSMTSLSETLMVTAVMHCPPIWVRRKGVAGLLFRLCKASWTLLQPDTNASPHSQITWASCLKAHMQIKQTFPELRYLPNSVDCCANTLSRSLYVVPLSSALGDACNRNGLVLFDVCDTSASRKSQQSSTYHAVPTK